MSSNEVFYFALGFLLGLIGGGVLLMVVLSAAMLSSRISRTEEDQGQ